MSIGVLYVAGDTHDILSSQKLRSHPRMRNRQRSVFFLPSRRMGIFFTHSDPARPIYDAAQFVELMTEFDVAMDPLHLRRLFAS